ncbi:MAG: polysaccharide deacetylase family protein [Candidatus Sericytochromatia bacterium]|nr:polysaccharide deacetylase family protein [Candidatus Sericytochromatia bacterium]
MDTLVANPYHGVPLLPGLPIATHLATTARELVLTFDDGPHPDWSGLILDVLARKDVRATFFLVGHNARNHPELVRRMAAEGHVLANHTDTHPKLPEIADADIETEIARCQETLERLTGKRPALFRPTYGRYDARVMKTLASEGLTAVQWSMMTWDWLAPTVEEALAWHATQLAPGGIGLLHDGSNIRRDSRAATLAMLPHLIDQARDAGYAWVPLDERIQLLA